MWSASSGAGSLLGAALVGNEQAVMECLRTPDVNVNEPCADWGGTPLMCAAERQHSRICRLLLARGADYCILDTFGQTCMHRAAQSGHANIVEVLLGYAPVDLRNEAGQTALHIAAEAGATNVVGVLLQYRAELLAVDRGGCTALELAQRRNHKEVSELLDRLIQEREFSLPLELQPYSRDILAAYKRALHHGRKRLLRQRLVIIGDKESGKQQLWSALLGTQEAAPEQEQDSAGAATRPPLFYTDRMVYHIQNRKFSDWGAHSCGQRRATQRIFEQHDHEVARLLLSEILRSPLGRVASKRLAQDRMQQLVDKLVREVKDRTFQNSVAPVQPLSTPQAENTIGLSATFRDDVKLRQHPPGHVSSADPEDGDGDAVDDASVLAGVPDPIIQRVSVLWRKVLAEGVGVLDADEPSMTEVHVSRVAGSRRLWNIVSPFLSHTALYLATFDLSASRATDTAAAAGCGSEQEQNLRSQLMTVISQQPTCNYIHRSWEGQEQPTPAYIVCGVERSDPNQQQQPQQLPPDKPQVMQPMMERIRSSAVRAHEVEAGNGGANFRLQDPQQICFLRRMIDLTMRLLLRQKGNSSMIPLAWLKLEDSFHKVRAHGQYFMSVEDECLEMARKETCNVVNDVFSLCSALSYFHAMGWIAYFPHVPALANTIFTDPPFLINLLANVLGASVDRGQQPAKLQEHIVTLHETGRMTQPLLDHYREYFDKYTTLGNGRSLLEDFDLAASYDLHGEPVMYAPGAASSDARLAAGTVACAGNPPALHLVFPDRLPVFGFLQRLLVHVMRRWKPACTALARQSAQFWIDDGDWQLTVQETGGSIAVTVVDPLASQSPESGCSDKQTAVASEKSEVEQGTAAVTTDAETDEPDVSHEPAPDDSLVSDSGEPPVVDGCPGTAPLASGLLRTSSSPCTSLEAARRCNDVLDFVLDITTLIRDRWFRSLSIRVCFDSEEVGAAECRDTPAEETCDSGSVGEVETPLHDRYVDCAQCAGLPSTWCWLSGPASSKL